jgi:hypothetical protein
VFVSIFHILENVCAWFEHEGSVDEMRLSSQFQEALYNTIVVLICYNKLNHLRFLSTKNQEFLNKYDIQLLSRDLFIDHSPEDQNAFTPTDEFEMMLVKMFTHNKTNNVFKTLEYLVEHFNFNISQASHMIHHITLTQEFPASTKASVISKVLTSFVCAERQREQQTNNLLKRSVFAALKICDVDMYEWSNAELYARSKHIINVKESLQFLELNVNRTYITNGVDNFQFFHSYLKECVSCYDLTFQSEMLKNKVCKDVVFCIQKYL